MVFGIREAQWIRGVLKAMRKFTQLSTRQFYENQSTIAIANNSVRHVEIEIEIDILKLTVTSSRRRLIEV